MRFFACAAVLFLALPAVAEDGIEDGFAGVRLFIIQHARHSGTQVAAKVDHYKSGDTFLQTVDMVYRQGARSGHEKRSTQLSRVPLAEGYRVERAGAKAESKSLLGDSYADKQIRGTRIGYVPKDAPAEATCDNGLVCRLFETHASQPGHLESPAGDLSCSALLRGYARGIVDGLLAELKVPAKADAFVSNANYHPQCHERVSLYTDKDGVQRLEHRVDVYARLTLKPTGR